MTEDEKYVREHWEIVHLHERGGSFFVLYGGLMNVQGGNVGSTCVDTVFRWAASSTRTRLQQIRDVEEEIEWLSHVGAGSTAIRHRVIIARQAALADLKRGLVERISA